MSDTEELKYEVSDSVLANVAKIAALDVPGIAGLSTTIVDSFVVGMSERLGKKRMRGVAVKNEKGLITIDIFLIAYYGDDLRILAGSVQHAVKEAIQSMMDTASIQVNVSIEDVILKDSGQ